MSITGANEKTSKTMLSKANWNVESAIDNYFNSAPPAAATNSGKIESLFTTYSGGEPEIGGEGIQRLCADIRVDPMDPVTLMLAYHLRAETMGVFKKEEFVTGLANLGCDTIDKLRAKVPELRSQMENPRTFKEFYQFVFNFSRDPGMRNVEFDTAIALWRLLLAQKLPRIEEWITFMEARERKLDVSKDTWNMIYDFLRLLENDGLQGYDPSGAWPVLIDEFVEYLSSK